MGFVIDLTGKKFGRLNVVSEIKERTLTRQVLWACMCDCGGTAIVLGNHLKTGHTKSCGCVAIENSSKIIHGQNRRGLTTPEYNIWSNMKNRCNNPNYKQYDLYGERGIRVCDRWNNFLDFFSDMGKRPSIKHSIERINNNGDYEKSNCKWATMKEQARNRRSNRWIEFEGKRMILKEWSDYLNATPSNILKMLKRKTFPEVVNYYQSK